MPGLLVGVVAAAHHGAHCCVLEAHGVLGIEMEASGLYTIAARYGRRALAICTVSDLIRTHEKTSSKERETGFQAMVEVALESAFA